MSIFSRLKKTVKKTTEPSSATSDTQVKEAADKKSAAKPASTSKANAPAKVKASKVISATTAETLLAPLVTEKSAHLADVGVYAFKVPVSASRVAVRQAFKDLYKVTPVKVNVIRVHGKEHRFGQVFSRRADWKKALVTVAKGARIDIFEKL